MKITFISLGISTDAIGPRILSSILRRKNFQTRLLFLPTLADVRRRKTQGKKYNYSERVQSEAVEICRDSDLIGVSLMTHHFSVAESLTNRFKQELSAPVLWGGIHPTVRPEESLKTADLVCAGEAESAIVELAEKMRDGADMSDIEGIWLKKDGRFVDNGFGPLAGDLDSLPYPDYSFTDHYLLTGDSIERMTKENWHQHLIKFFPPMNRQNSPDRPAYQVLSARGCPFKCAFCGETPLAERIYGRAYFRKRSIDNLIGELAWVKETFPFIGEICFCDDTFASRNISEIKEFSEKYKERIHMPFYFLVSPANVSKEKFDPLVDAGLTHVGMGIQSGSSRIVDLYNRQKAGGVAQSLKAAEILNSYKDRLLPFYDFIVENPYETRKDKLETVKLLIKLPRPYRTRVYSLSFFPGTPLYDKAWADGILDSDLYDKTFGQRTQVGYLSFIIDLNMINIPGFVLRLLIARPFLFIFDRPAGDFLFQRLRRVVKNVADKLKLSQKGLS